MSPQDTTNHRPQRPIRVEKELWDPFGAAVGDRRRSEVLREFIRWYLREPGAKLPDRPPRRPPGRDEP